MDREDKEFWEKCMEWGVCRIAAYLDYMETGQGGGWNPKNEFGESILSLEIHEFFRNGRGRQSIAMADISEGTGAGRLKKLLELDDFECFCVILAMLGELDYHFEKLFIYLNNDWNQRLLSIEWAIRLYTMELEPDISYLSCFLAGGKLEQRVFHIRAENAGSGLRRGLKLREPVLEFLLRSGRFGNKPYLRWNLGIKEALPVWPEEEICRYLESAAQGRPGQSFGVIFHLWGSGRKELLLYPAWYAAEKERPLGILDYGRMEQELEPEQIAMVPEEIFLAEGVLCIRNVEYLQGEEKSIRKFSLFLQAAAEQNRIVFIITTMEKRVWDIPWDADYIPMEIQPSKGRRRRELWKALANGCPVPEEVLEQAGSQFDFGIQEIGQSLREAGRLAFSRGEETISEEVLSLACRRQSEHNLKEWAVLMKKCFTWEDLVLPEDQKEMLQEAANQIRYRRQVYEEWGFAQIRPYGIGLNLLLTGPPGTGKTMAAQVLAAELGMELYKIQLPAVVSKYIGETERNMKRIFEEGKKSQAILFFDEADVLFGRRTEVKDSHDKYSNMEAAYMLQNMEEYTGVVVLATNFPQNIDEAFKRRITMTVKFYMPDGRHRLLLWQKSVPKQLPVSPDVDFERLAGEFELSGSNIKNIMINAAFLAASVQQPVGREHIQKALKRELAKSGKHFSEEWEV